MTFTPQTCIVKTGIDFFTPLLASSLLPDRIVRRECRRSAPALYSLALPARLLHATGNVYFHLNRRKTVLKRVLPSHLSRHDRNRLKITCKWNYFFFNSSSKATSSREQGRIGGGCAEEFDAQIGSYKGSKCGDLGVPSTQRLVRNESFRGIGK
ncbi:unnamed protein product [Protopolystoma xenopodis]|uniref:Uncharacterized protein n=1 Tax=Protopolystoma xenopodis TaxID=117903 RepID=A0A448X671_9PLAT|nr:unnamed protein product [Protopolystoma xenopodis]